MCSSGLIVPLYFSKAIHFCVLGSNILIILVMNRFLSTEAKVLLTRLDGHIVPPRWLACGKLDTSAWGGYDNCEWCHPLNSTFSCCKAIMSSACLCCMFIISSRSILMASPWSSPSWGEGGRTRCECRGVRVSTIDWVVATMLFGTREKRFYPGPTVGPKMYLQGGNQVIFLLANFLS